MTIGVLTQNTLSTDSLTKKIFSAAGFTEKFELFRKSRSKGTSPAICRNESDMAYNRNKNVLANNRNGRDLSV